VHAPPHEAPGLGPGIIAMNRLSTLRYHRSDSHAAAWLAAGWTVERIQQFPWGSDWTTERQTIEDDTNARAASPFAVLTAGERLQFLAALAALT